MKRKFWTCYLSVIVFVLGGVYIATANLDSVPLLLSSTDMQQLVGAYEENARCGSTDGCSVIQCWDSPAHIATKSWTIFRCTAGNTWCDDLIPPENDLSCQVWVYDADCDNGEGPTPTLTYWCVDGT